MVFKKTTKVTGNFKSVMVLNGDFIDTESGEKIDLAEVLGDYYGIASFSIATSRTDVEELDGGEA